MLCAVLSDPLLDLHRFPPVEVSYPNYLFAVRHCEWLVARSALYPDEAAAFDYEGWLLEAQACKAAWTWLDDAHRPGDPAMRRGLLRQLRELIGDEAYAAGRMPGAAPWHRFRRH